MSAEPDPITALARDLDDRLLMLARAESRDSGATPHADAATRALVALVGHARRLERDLAAARAIADRALGEQHH